MDFCKKLQQLRKQKELTQEQLAEELFVSRTAISKWESGKGYPNIDSLKSISKLFSVSIDDLLSSEELISLAAFENRFNINKVFGFVYGVLDIMTLVFIFLPFYGQPDGEVIRSVTLSAYRDISDVTRFLYFAFPILMALLGVVELFIQDIGSEKWLENSKTCSIILQAVMILLFTLTRQPYVTSLLFMFFMIKVFFLLKGRRLE